LHPSARTTPFAYSRIIERGTTYYRSDMTKDYTKLSPGSGTVGRAQLSDIRSCAAIMNGDIKPFDPEPPKRANV